MKTTPTIWTPPQRWITEVSPDGIVRAVQCLTPDHLVITLHDIPAMLGDQFLVDDRLADKAFNAIIRRAG